MGLITSSFPFLVGTVCGIYIAQNYDVPNIKKVWNDVFSKAKHVEEKYRKPKRGTAVGTKFAAVVLQTLLIGLICFLMQNLWT